MSSSRNIKSDLFSAVASGKLNKTRELIDEYGLSFSDSNGYVLLGTAIKNRHLEIAKLLLTSGCNVNSRSVNPTDTPLHFAVLCGHIGIIKMLLIKGADINIKNRNGISPLFHAIGRNKLEIVELFFEYAANSIDKNDASLLAMALQKENLQIVRILLKNGANHNCRCSVRLLEGRYIHGCSPLHFAVAQNSLEVMTLLLSKGINADVKADNGVTAMHIAATNKNVHFVIELLNHGACIHSISSEEGYMPLHFASEHGNEEIVKLFLNRGADADANTKDNLTPLHIAVKNLHTTVVRLLLHHGAKVDKGDANGRTILHLAVEFGANLYAINELHVASINRHVEVVKTILEFGADINSTDCYGRTALHFASNKGCNEVVELLLNRGADVNANTKDNLTPLHVAVKKRNITIVRLLLQHGAIVDKQDGDGGTILHLALDSSLDYKLNFGYQTRIKHQVEVVKTLLEFGADINSTDRYGRTVLHIASNKMQDELIKVLKRHIIQMKTATLYVSFINLQSLELTVGDELSNFQNECEGEIISMKREKINNYISFYDILTKSVNSLAICLRNENTVPILKLHECETKFPIYASMIKTRFRNGLKRKELLEQANKIFGFFFTNFPLLPQDCSEQILSYLTDEDLKNFNKCF